MAKKKDKLDVFAELRYGAANPRPVTVSALEELDGIDSIAELKRSVNAGNSGKEQACYPQESSSIKSE